MRWIMIYTVSSVRGPPAYTILNFQCMHTDFALQQSGKPQQVITASNFIVIGRATYAGIHWQHVLK
jgi:hypothetical protein